VSRVPKVFQRRKNRGSSLQVAVPVRRRSKERIRPRLKKRLLLEQCFRGRTIMGRKTGCRPPDLWARKNMQRMWKRGIIKKRKLANGYCFKKNTSPSSSIVVMINSKDAIPPHPLSFSEKEAEARAVTDQE
ncbi:unnamed protein product, partial [Thlaspi arvense]